MNKPHVPIPDGGPPHPAHEHAEVDQEAAGILDRLLQLIGRGGVEVDDGRSQSPVDATTFKNPQDSPELT